MSGRGRWIGIVLGVALALLAVWALLRSPVPGRPGTTLRPAAAVATPVPATPSPRAGRIPPVEADRPTITTLDREGRRQWELHAESAEANSASGTVVLTNVEGTYFQKGEPAIRFLAPRGTFFVATRNVTLEGRVRARAASGRTLEADVVKWFPRTQQVEASGHVMLRQKEMTVFADHLMADVALQRTRLQGNIRVTVTE